MSKCRYKGIDNMLEIIRYLYEKKLGYDFRFKFIVFVFWFFGIYLEYYSIKFLLFFFKKDLKYYFIVFLYIILLYFVYIFFEGVYF